MYSPVPNYSGGGGVILCLDPKWTENRVFDLRNPQKLFRTLRAYVICCKRYIYSYN